MTELKQRINVARSEIRNLRTQVYNLKQQNSKEVEKIKALLQLSQTFEGCQTCLPTYTEDPNQEDNEAHKTSSILPIGYVHSWYKSKNGTPRQSSISQASRATITIDKDVFSNPDHALDGLAKFSHIWLLSYFHENGNSRPKAKIRPPRLNGETVGVLASRSPHRPSPIGLTLSKLDEIKGNILHVSGIDLLEGTPVLDIKPYIAEYDAPKYINVHPGVDASQMVDVAYKEPQWIHSPPVGQLTVLFTPRALEGLSRFHAHSDNCNFCFSSIRGIEEATSSIVDMLKADPRSVYRRKQCQDRLYYFVIDTLHVTCWFDDDGVVEVLRVSPVSEPKVH